MWTLSNIYIPFDKVIARSSPSCLKSDFVLTGFLIEIAAWCIIQTSFPSRTRTRGSIADDIREKSRDTHSTLNCLSPSWIYHLPYKDGGLSSCTRGWIGGNFFFFLKPRDVTYSRSPDVGQRMTFLRETDWQRSRAHIRTNTSLKFFNMSMHDQLFINPSPYRPRQHSARAISSRLARFIQRVPLAPCRDRWSAAFVVSQPKRSPNENAWKCRGDDEAKGQGRNEWWREVNAEERDTLLAVFSINDFRGVEACIIID